MYANKTDAIYLSIGMAQYNHNQLLAKVMRNEGGHWSPQSEELPIHRPIDLSILIAKVLFDNSNDQVEIQGGTYAEQHNQVVLTPENTSTTTFKNWIDANGDDIKERLNSLCDILNDLRRRNKI